MRTKQEIEQLFTDRSALEGYSSFFLVGIGGAGMSGLARMLQDRGYRVRGTDWSDSPVVQALQSRGITVQVGAEGEVRPEPSDALVLTDATPLDSSPEVARARELQLDMFRRSQVLGWLLKKRKVIAVTGTHGKTTTTGMIAAGLIESGLDPLVVVGAEVPQFGGAIIEGEGEYAVVEACEAYDSLRDIDPYIVVLTNLELDHVDFHGSFESLQNAVRAFVERVPKGGHLVYCAADDGARLIAESVNVSRVPYSHKEFGIVGGMSQRGAHNELNAAAALTVARLVGAEPNLAARGIAGFSGAERRQQHLGSFDGVDVIDDYAHHPTEIEASIQGIRDHWLGAGKGRLIVVFQPHLYSRTEGLIKEFAAALSKADVVVITDIYPAREEPIPGVSSARIAELVTAPVRYVPSRHLLPRFVKRFVREGDVVVGMGAGNIAEFGPSFLKELARTGCKRVAVLYGGDSAEREVSLNSGMAVAAALSRKGYEVKLIDATDQLLSSGNLSMLTGDGRPDVVMLALHGTNAEDGAIQGLMELLHLPYTGSGIRASAIAMDKELTKRMLEEVGLPVPKGIKLSSSDGAAGKVMTSMPDIRAFVVKPNAQGSTVGLSFVKDADELQGAIEKALWYGDEVLVEELLEGVEVSCPVLGDRSLPPVEIAPTEHYDFAAKYVPGATLEICPARLSEHVLDRIQQYALKAHQALGCEGATRTDMIVSGDDIRVLEVNTLPGMTATSLLPQCAEVAGIGFDELCEWLINDALRRDAKTD